MSALNQVLFSWIHHAVGKSAVLDFFGIVFAVYAPYVIVAVFLVLVCCGKGVGDRRRRFYLFAEAALAVILARGIITTVIRFWYYHARPFEFYGFAPLVSAAGSSFPSGHAAWFFALAMAAWYANRRWGTWFFIFAAVVSIARIYAGVHWPLDVLGGAAVGVGSAVLVHWLLRSPREHHTTAQPSASSRA